MSFSLDYNNILTWENIDCQSACIRLSTSEENEGNCFSFNKGAFRVIADLFNKIKDKNERAQFFLNCENLGLRSWKLFFAYKYPCHEDYDNFVQCVMKSDKVMIKALKDKEKEMQ